MEPAFAKDIADVGAIAAVPTILNVICQSTGLGFAAVARVTEDRWIACAVRDDIAFGLQAGGELQVQTTICNEIRASGREVVIDHASEDAVFRDHHTPKMYGIQSYISVPIYRPDGRFFGTLCGIDPRPARLNTPETVGMFKLFAQLIGFHLDARERLATSEEALLGERETAQLREQFIAVLGHDLRNPLGSIDAGAHLLQTMPLPEKAVPVVARIQRSAARIAGLIDNVLDFARGRLGDGISITREPDPNLSTRLEHVISELRAAWPGRMVAVDIALDRPVNCDGPRVAQLLSNLLANALAHGDADGPVRVSARRDDAGFALWVSNTGAPIPPETAEQLFRPFVRRSGQAGQQGLGLGLYIASEIARAHGGSLEAESTPEETRFTLRLPD